MIPLLLPYRQNSDILAGGIWYKGKIGMEPSPGCRILIIDDEPGAVKLLELILTRRRNDQVIIATSGLEGLDMAEKVNPDLIIVRIMMNPDGFEICRQLKQIPTLVNVPVLLQAAMAMERVYPTAKKIGAAGYLYQPFGPDALVECRDTVLQGGLYYPPPDSDGNHAAETANE
jgi:CheY-like chemotaxis protein